MSRATDWLKAQRMTRRVHGAGAVNQHLVIGIPRTEDDHVAVIPVPQPIVHFQQDRWVAAVFAGHGAGGVIESKSCLGECRAVVGSETPVTKCLPAQYIPKYLPNV